MAPLRVGSVPYLVGRPLDLGLGDEPGITLFHDVPARLVAGLRDGSVDVALVSSIELFRRPGYGYVDGLGVAGRGFVGSVQVFLRRPIEEVRSIAMDPVSRTAAALTRTLLLDRPGGPPEFIEVELGQDPRAVEEADAWLRIGDAALRETVAEDLDAWNPSEHWTRRTGLPFVFAPWIVAPGVDMEAHLDAFRRARARGAAALQRLADEAAAEWQLPREACRTYLADECSYEPGPEMEASLLAFRDGAARFDLCEPELVPRAW